LVIRSVKCRTTRKMESRLLFLRKVKSLGVDLNSNHYGFDIAKFDGSELGSPLTRD